jgi:hypothetical protein
MDEIKRDYLFGSVSKHWIFKFKNQNTIEKTFAFLSYNVGRGRGAGAHQGTKGRGGICSNAIVKANAEVIAQSMTKLIQTTMNGVRDLNPNDNLKNLRIKTTKKEMLVSHSNEFVVIVIQAWQPAKEEQ